MLCTHLYATDACGPLLKVKPLFFYVHQDGNANGMILGLEDMQLIQLPTYIQNSIASADDVTFETKNSGSWLAALPYFVSLTQPPLAKTLSATAWSKLRQRAGRLPAFVVNRLTPLGAAIFFGTEDSIGLEDQLRAHATGARIRGLEKPVVLWQILKRTFTIQDLEVMLTEANPTLVQTYGDEAAIEERVARMRTENPKIWKSQLVYRNVEWLPKIEKIISRPGRHLIAVPADHLVGEYGLVSQLRRRGYTVTRLE